MSLMVLTFAFVISSLSLICATAASLSSAVGSPSAAAISFRVRVRGSGVGCIGLIGLIGLPLGCSGRTADIPRASYRPRPPRPHISFCFSYPASWPWRTYVCMHKAIITPRQGLYYIDICMHKATITPRQGLMYVFVSPSPSLCQSGPRRYGDGLRCDGASPFDPSEDLPRGTI